MKLILTSVFAVILSGNAFCQSFVSPIGFEGKLFVVGSEGMYLDYATSEQKEFGVLKDCMDKKRKKGIQSPKLLDCINNPIVPTSH